MKHAKWHRLLMQRQLPILLALYLTVTALFAVGSYLVLIRDMREDLGSKAMTLAVDISHWLQLDRSTYDRLLGLEFEALLKDPVNQAFEATARETMAHSEIKYIYLRSALPPEQVRYHVTEETAAKYNVPSGTALSNVYVLDAVVDDGTRLADTEGQGYAAEARYTVEDPVFGRILQERKPAYALATEEWGTYISGYAPYYSPEGDFLGMIGVDLTPQHYYRYVQKSLILLGTFAAFLLCGGILLSGLLSRVWRAEERIRMADGVALTDPVTGLMNRRSFLQVLAHAYAVCRREGMPLALILCEPRSPEYAFDELMMRAAADYIGTCARRSSDGLCRYSESAFLIFLHNTEAEDAQALAQGMAENGPFPLTAAVVALMPEEPFEEGTLLQTLELTLEAAKKQGLVALLDETL